MQLPPLRIFALALAVALGLTACAASTKIVNQWVSPDYTSPRFRKILVIGVSKQPSIRRTFEDEFVTQLKVAGVEAVPSYLYIPENGQVEENRLAGRGKAGQCRRRHYHAVGPGRKKDRSEPGLLSARARRRLRLL